MGAQMQSGGRTAGFRDFDGETPSCDGLCGGRTRSKSNGFPAARGGGPPSGVTPPSPVTSPPPASRFFFAFGVSFIGFHK